MKYKMKNLFKEQSCIYKMLLVFVTVLICIIIQSGHVYGQKLVLNDQGYFETRGVNILVYSNQYTGMFFDEKTAGIEIIHHGVRTSTGGAIRMQNTPEQWDLIPLVTDRKVDAAGKTITADLSIKEISFNSRISVTAKDKGVEINVYLDNPLPKELEGKAGFNLEFLPSSYFEKTYLADGRPGNFPKYPSSDTKIEPVSNKLPQFAGHNTFDDRGRGEFIVPLPMATGNTLILAPEDPACFVKIQGVDVELMLFDGRDLAQNGWFVVRSLLPANKTGKVLTWYLEPNAIPNWTRKPVIGFSQAGYVPVQEKVAVIELDMNDTSLKTALVFQVTAEGKSVEKFRGEVKVWGKYLRYNYAKFDFSSVKEPGVYFIRYGDQKTNTFRIAQDVYENVWHPTLDVWFPVQMDHMQVNEAYRVWHGAPFLDDCLQAPLNHQHFDGYRMGATTDTKYKPLERIPNMAVGGWFDAGDFDIQTGSHNSVVLRFVEAWENLKVDRDETYIDQKTRYVDIHRPDGKPDILQQIEHGTLNLVAQCENIGHPVQGIIVPNLHQYHHLGDAMTETDNLPYNPNLKPYETDGKSSGTLDDRWAFTTRQPFLDYSTAATLAAASRALRGFNDDLADRSLVCAKRLLEEANEASKNANANSNNPMMMRRGSDMDVVLQLYITTKDKKYADRFLEQIWASLEPPAGGPGGAGQRAFLGRGLISALKALPYMDAAYKAKLKDYVIKYIESLAEVDKQNPYGVPISLGTWGGSGTVVSWAITNYFAYKAFPEIMSKEYVLRGLNYIFGCHPYSNISFVNAVGTSSKKVAYGTNRADFTTIAGGIVPGLILLKPDLLENKDDWPFLWGENEVTIGGSADYIFLAKAASEIAGNSK
jgi:endoglucanase